MSLHQLHPAYAAAKSNGMTDNEFIELLNKQRLKDSQLALDRMLEKKPQQGHPPKIL